jgi:DNA-damage-inducible protein D
MDDDLDNFSTYSFELNATENGTVMWAEEYVMRVLGYVDRKSFRKVILKAIRACTAVPNVAPFDHFVMSGNSYKLSRLACYLVAMSGDNRKPQVALFQAYLGSLADQLHTYHEQSETLNRVEVRDEIAESLKSLARTAQQHGVERYALFMNAGYLGMYNMNFRALCQFKGVGQREKLMDRMGRTELAANFFRVTQTDDKIKNDDIQGQKALEDTARSVGKSVRDTMFQISGTRPENLPLEANIKEARTTLKDAGLKVLDLGSTSASKALRLKALNDGYDELKELSTGGGAGADPEYTADPDDDDQE